MNNSIRSGLRNGLLTGLTNIFVILLGLTSLVGTLVMGWFDLSSQVLGAWIILLLVALWGGVRAARRPSTGSGYGAGAESWGATLITGLLAGIFHGLMVAAFIGVISAVLDSGADLRQWLAQLTPDAIELLRSGRTPLVAAGVIWVALTAAGSVGALLAEASARYQWRAFLADQRQKARTLSKLPVVRNASQFQYTRYVVSGLGLLVLIAVPFRVGQYWNYTLGTVGIYVILGLGLNIVVGLAGLLDLGYVAFFAIGAYTVAILTGPEPHGLLMNFWLVLPIGIIMATISGVLLGIPVLGMRGDYLAIVTLGFGEIIRILSKSDLLIDFTGGPRGIRAVGGPSLFDTDLNSEFHFMYFIILGIVLVAFITNRLQHSRVGRAWMAMREDEDVAEAMGIYTLKYKLLAFAIGAAFAGLGGVIFASRNQFTGPEDFTLLVSINVLCLVIIGGMGSIPGVVLGALALKGLPEVLRELDEYRILAFGALLVVMMIVRPEGLWPSSRRKLELFEHIEQAAEGAAGPVTGD
jgi:branched-chain amino acid transport system permease protein